MNEELRNNTNLPPLPQGWVWVRLGEIAEIISGVSFKPEQLCKQDAENVRILRGGNIQNDDYFLLEDDYFVPKDIVSNDQLLRKYDIILVSSTGSKQAIGKAAIIKEELNNLSVGAFLRIIRIYENIQKKYIGFYFYTLSYRNYIREIVKGVNINNIKDSYLNEMFLPLPPLPEQRRIVAKIEELFTKLDAGVEALKKAKEQIKRYRQAVLKYAFEGKLTEEWRKSFELSILNDELKQTQNPQLNTQNSTFKTENSTLNTQNSKLPKGWMWVRVKDIGEVVTGTTPSKTKQEYYGKDYPFFKPTDLNAGYYVKKSEDSLSKKGISKARLLPSKSILVTCIGATIGKTGFIRIPGASNQQINAIIPYDNILPEYIYFICISPQFQKSIVGNASATTLPILNKSSFEVLPLPLPPLAEQHRVVEEIERRFSVVDEVEKAIDRSLKEAERLRQSILKRAFEGKLVPQDPNDEPAEKLLERIREEKARRESEKKVKKKGGR